MLHFVKNIVLFICCCISLGVFAQSPGAKIFTLGGEYQEPPHINTLCQLSQGYILLGTTKGLYRFDGINFYEYGKSRDVPDTVTAVCELHNKEILIGFSNGAIGKLQNNVVVLQPFEEGFPKVAITKIVPDKNGVTWFATAGEGLYFYKNHKLYNTDTADGLSDDFVYDVVAINSNNILASTDRGINLCTSDEKHKIIQHFTSRNGLPDNIVRCMFVAQDKDVWVGMQDGGITGYNISKPNAAQKLDWQYGQVNAVMVFNSRVFVATEESGLLIFGRDANNNITTLQYRDEQLKKASCLLKDREGNLWIAGNNQLMRSSALNVQPLLTLDKINAENIHTIYWSKDSSVWFNTLRGVTQLKEQNGVWQEKQFVISGVRGESISTIYQDVNGTMWIGTLGKGIVLLEPSTGKQHSLQDVSNLINANIISISGRDSVIWISAFEATVCAIIKSGKTNFISYAGVENLGNKYVYSILEDNKNRVWFGTDGKGIIQYQNGKFSELPQPKGGYGNVVYKLAEDKAGNIWFSTYDKGLIKYDGKTFARYTAAQGLSDINITGLCILGDNILLPHKNNIDLINTQSGSIIYIDADQGINNINTDLNALASDNEGNAYFVADTILYKYNAAKETLLRPLVMIDKVQLFLNDVNVANGYTFRHNENNLSFYFTGLYYSQPARIQYQYKLEGYDKNWIMTRDRIKNFPKLPPGDYTFKVRVSLNQNFAATYETAFSFTIEKPFWQKWWFIMLCVIVGAATLYLIVKQREKSIQKYNRLQREKIQSQLETLRNQINPHFLFNSFNTLVSEIEEHPGNAVTYVEHLSDFYRNIVVHREKDLITLEEEINILHDYCFIQQKRYGSALQINIDVSKDKQQQYCIVPLALQLLFENAIKHNAISIHQPLQINLFISSEEQLIIRNNINKKITPEKGSSMGLQNIQKRYQLLIRKNVIVENDNTFFTVKIPLIKR